MQGMQPTQKKHPCSQKQKLLITSMLISLLLRIFTHVLYAACVLVFLPSSQNDLR